MKKNKIIYWLQSHQQKLLMQVIKLIYVKEVKNWQSKSLKENKSTHHICFKINKITFILNQYYKTIPNGFNFTA